MTLETRGWSDARKEPQAEKCKQPPEAETHTQILVLPVRLQNEHRLADILS